MQGRTLGILAGLLCLAVLAGCSQNVPSAPVVDAGFQLQPFLTGFSSPTFVASAGDHSGRLFVLEQAGTVKVWDGNTATTFLDLRAQVDGNGERGLLGLAFHPDYAANGRLFVHYDDRNGNTVVSEFKRLDALHADPASERLILHVDQPYSNHNGGMLTFGPDGMLYLGLGDGGGAGDPGNRAQSLDSLLGKVLRLDVDSAPAPIPYTIPPDNPFATQTQGAEIWLYGLRNPWRFSFDRGAADGTGKGDLWIGDVGQNHYEEVDLEVAGSHGGTDFGWSRFEGNHLYASSRSAPDAVGPIAEYDHDGGHCAVTGGYVYRGTAMPALQGTYLFADYCSGYVWTLKQVAGQWEMKQAMDTSHAISSFGEDDDGELYVVDHDGSVLKIVAA